MPAPDESKAQAEKTRRRLMRGFAEVVQDKGYSSVTVLDIVKSAGVSKRTFYEHFTDKEACLVACYLEGSAVILQTMANALDPAAPWLTQIRTLVASYLGALKMHPAMMGTVFIEIQAASGRILAQRRQVTRAFVDALIKFSTHLSQQNPALKMLSPQAALILVGGVNEMVLLAAEERAIDQISKFEDGIVEMVADLIYRRVDSL